MMSLAQEPKSQQASERPNSVSFALIGVGGYIAPRHLQAIKDTGNELVATFDLAQNVGILDKYFPNAAFFTEFERFDRHCEKLRRIGAGKQVQWVSVCSPNYLHDAHIRFGLRIGANVICEKPLVINPWNLDALEEIERETGKKVYTVLQLRKHPAIIAIKNKIKQENMSGSDKVHDIELTYITPRGPWYFSTWKGDEKRSGGVAMNIGIHFFDMLLWIFGKVKKSVVTYRDAKRTAGYLELERARVKWFLSIDASDLEKLGKENLEKGNKSTSAHRSLTINGEEVEFSEGFADLHTQVYKETLAGRGYTISDARPSIELVYDIRESQISNDTSKEHSLLSKIKNKV